MGATLTPVVALVVAVLYGVRAQYSQPTPVPILKQINRHNEDGSYSYGYEGADGSFKIETKHPTGEVYGKYGYVDDSGSLREVEYGASRRGFEPAGTGINVPPPTLHSNDVGPDGYDDGQYREDPSIYYKNAQYKSNTPPLRSYSNPQPATQYYNPPQPRSQPQYYNPPAQQHHYNPPAQQHHYNPPAQQHHYNPPAQQHHYNPPAQQHHYNPPAQQHYYNPPAQQHYDNSVAQKPFFDPSIFRGHPAANFNLDTGSYSISYSG